MTQNCTAATGTGETNRPPPARLQFTSGMGIARWCDSPTFPTCSVSVVGNALRLRSVRLDAKG